VATPYLPSVQALLLITIALRCRYKDEQAWHILAQAVRVAHSIGLHRYIRPSSKSPALSGNPSAGYQAGMEINARIWWSCYALEKLMELETGRPSAINDEDIDQIIPSGSLLAPAESPDFFALWVKLARILSQISKQLYRNKPTSARQLMFEIGTLDQQLLEWVNSMPDSIKPGHELFDDHSSGHQPNQQDISSFLSAQYYQVGQIRSGPMSSELCCTNTINRHKLPFSAPPLTSQSSHSSTRLNALVQAALLRPPAAVREHMHRRRPCHSLPGSGAC
jgi:hypothetical protein